MDKFWSEIDKTLELHSEYILSDEQRKLIADEEQKSYEKNIEIIEQITTEFDNELKKRNFWTELIINKEGFRYRYSYKGYYGPGGFSSQFHIAGPLVLGLINPAKDALASFYKNNLEENIQIGCNFDANEFRNFIEKTILSYVSTNNLIISKEQYDNLRNFKINN